MGAEGAGAAVECCSAMSGRLLAVEHGQQGKGAARGQGPEVLDGGQTNMTVV